MYVHECSFVFSIIYDVNRAKMINFMRESMLLPEFAVTTTVALQVFIRVGSSLGNWIEQLMVVYKEAKKVFLQTDNTSTCEKL